MSDTCLHSFKKFYRGKENIEIGKICTKCGATDYELEFQQRIADLEKEKERLKRQESSGMDCTIDQMLSIDLQQKWGLDKQEHGRNIQLMFVRAIGAINDLESENNMSKKHISTLGVKIINTERIRQLNKWGTNHDDGHCSGEMPIEAAKLCCSGTCAKVYGSSDTDWGLVKKHENDRIKQLAIAGALIAAEIERLKRIERDGE